MNRAIELSIQNVQLGGGPFGAVIVKDGKIIGEGCNSVTRKNDPTAHAEVEAIRNAAQKAGSFDLSGATIYTSCEPCPMCLSAIYWARMDQVFYANTKQDAAGIDFDDAFIYDELQKPMAKRQLKMVPLGRERAIEAFRSWSLKADKVPY